jgi:hypothetical protein
MRRPVAPLSASRHLAADRCVAADDCDDDRDDDAEHCGVLPSTPFSERKEGIRKNNWLRAARTDWRGEML